MPRPKPRSLARQGVEAGFRCAVVRVDPAYGGNLGTMNVAAFDENGVGGLNPADISVWLPDAFAFPQAYVGRSDFNCTNSINPADLAMLLNASLGSGSTHSGSPYCQ